MATVTSIFEERSALIPETASRSVSWPAIFAGATAAAALSLILLVLGMGLGFSALSPWAYGSGSAERLSWGAIIWMAVTALLASGFGGYIAGRLRDRWSDIQKDEVYFRDTAHGFLAWALATLVTAAALTSVIAAMLGTAAPLPAQATQLSDEARRNAAYASLWIFVSLLIGAFAASLMATFGGRQRDLP
jgi:MFS family permease